MSVAVPCAGTPIGGPSFKLSAAYRALPPVERATLLKTYDQMVEQFEAQLLAGIPAPHTQEQGRAVLGMASCSAGVYVEVKLLGKKDVDDAGGKAVESCFKRVEAQYKNDEWKAVPKLDVVDFVLDHDAYGGRTVVVAGRIQQRGDLTLLYQSDKSHPFVLVDTSELSRTERKRILVDCADGCPSRVIGTGANVMLQKGIKASKLE